MGRLADVLLRPTLWPFGAATSTPIKLQCKAHDHMVVPHRRQRKVGHHHDGVRERGNLGGELAVGQGVG